MACWSHFHHPVPGFSVSVHCITIFCMRLILYLVISGFLKRQGHKLIRSQYMKRDIKENEIKIRKTLVDIFGTWVPLRLMCPGIILRIDRWTCSATFALLPKSLDVFNQAADSHAFWVLYGWIEVLVFLSVLWYLWSTGPRKFPFTNKKVVKYISRMFESPGRFLSRAFHEGSKDSYPRKWRSRPRSVSGKSRYRPFSVQQEEEEEGEPNGSPPDLPSQFSGLSVPGRPSLSEGLYPGPWIDYSYVYETPSLSENAPVKESASSSSEDDEVFTQELPQ